MDFRYLTDALTPDEAVRLLESVESGKESREAEVRRDGFPAYTTSAGWLGYSDKKIRRLCREARAAGFTQFKIKVGRDLADDRRRCAILREEIGPAGVLMTDANQVWDVPAAVEWMKQLAEFRPRWIEEPTSPDDVLGHAAIARALVPLGIGVATGEHCQNRILFKQFMQAGALHYVQIDACRLGGVNECLAVMLLARKFGLPICPHAGGVALCEHVQHLSIWDYVACGASMEGRVIEYVDHLHEHFVDPVRIVNGQYVAPERPGYSTEMRAESLEAYEFPRGAKWRG